MASIRLNGQTIHLKEVSRDDFRNLTGAVYRAMKPEEPIQGTLVRILGDALHKEQPTDGPIIQTVLWMLADLGVKAVTVNTTESKASVDEWQETEASRADPRWFGVANIESGRAFAAAIVNIHGRAMILNGARMRTYPQPREEIQKMVEKIGRNRLVNEDMLFTACRTLGQLMREGKGSEDQEFRCALELVSGLGVADLVIDLQQNKLAIRSMNESSAIASTLLAGGDMKQIQGVRDRVRKMQVQLDEFRRKLAAGEVSPGGAGQAPPRVAVPPMIGNRRSKRRSN